jgi:diadenylate cyclase
VLIVFQPELRRGLTRLGETRWLRRWASDVQQVVDELIASVRYLSARKIGAIIAVEREVGLGFLVESGVTIDAQVTADLLNTVFWPGSALHDMGLIIRGGRVAAAGCQFPLAEGEKFPSELGSRHRAAVGLSLETDALIIVVSEETGTISLAERGAMTRGLTPEKLRELLLAGLGSEQDSARHPAAQPVGSKAQ